MSGYQVIISVSDNYKSSMSCKMSGVKYIRNQVITNKCQMIACRNLVSSNGMFSNEHSRYHYRIS